MFRDKDRYGFKQSVLCFDGYEDFQIGSYNENGSQVNHYVELIAEYKQEFNELSEDQQNDIVGKFAESYFILNFLQQQLDLKNQSNPLKYLKS